MENFKGRVRGIIEDALQKAGVSFDTDGENIWVGDEDGNTVSLNVIECAKSDEDEGQQQADEPEEDDENDLCRFAVSINATMGTVVEVSAPDESCAEEIVNRMWASGEIKLDELTNHETRIDCTGRAG